MSKKRVAVFWDYGKATSFLDEHRTNGLVQENCRPPSNLPGYTVVDKLRQLLQEYGSITLFKAYMEFTTENMNPKSLTLQSELQSSGVSLTNCPHNGRKDVADKMILGVYTGVCVARVTFSDNLLSTS